MPGILCPMREDVVRRHAVRDGGNPHGRPMVFAHGFGCDQTLWRFVTPAFEAEHRVITFDYIGAGASDRSAYDPVRYGSLDGYAGDILDICRALDLEDVILVGHSVSATIAMLASIAEPKRFGELVLVTPSPRYLDDLPEYPTHPSTGAASAGRTSTACSRCSTPTQRAGRRSSRPSSWAIPTDPS
jgi:sigma-B regulation protein RsbQ